MIPIVIPTLDADLPTRLADQLNAREPGMNIDAIIQIDEARTGFTRAVNEGLKVALQRDAAYIGIMTDDCQPQTDDWLAKLVAALEEDDANGVAAPLMPCRTEGVNGIKPRGTPFVVEHWGVPYGCVVIRREMLRDVGLLDPVFRHYCSDTDHQFRARRFGWRSVVCWHVYVEREPHPPRRPMWEQDQAALKRRWGS